MATVSPKTNLAGLMYSIVKLYSSVEQDGVNKGILVLLGKAKKAGPLGPGGPEGVAVEHSSCRSTSHFLDSGVLG